MKKQLLEPVHKWSKTSAIEEDRWLEPPKLLHESLKHLTEELPILMPSACED